jgi:hypothetical protein
MPRNSLLTRKWCVPHLPLGNDVRPRLQSDTLIFGLTRTTQSLLSSLHQSEDLKRLLSFITLNIPHWTSSNGCRLCIPKSIRMTVETNATQVFPFSRSVTHICKHLLRLISETCDSYLFGFAVSGNLTKNSARTVSSNRTKISIPS